MEIVTLQYRVMNIGKWTEARVSLDVANVLAEEYSSYGWSTKIMFEQAAALEAEI
ncbi:hypothetical protein [Vibrio sinensis]|uniref:hypothetical protein n=1 Tax=Vibrio sinensis TaxID=2302434 RepID=UPI001402F232|nr:hypothetical protein [Vibrio sinensis]